MAEIAAAAGVSVPTVSKVVNGRPDVAPRTRQAIEKLLVARGYTARRDRRTANSDRVGLIDLVFVDLGSPWAMAILAGVEEVAYRARSEEHTSELQSRRDLVCRLLLEKKKKKNNSFTTAKKKIKTRQN